MQTHPPLSGLAVYARPLVALALFLTPARAFAQCADPAVPQGGFAVTTLVDQPVTYGDGAETLMDIRYPSTQPGSCGWPVIIVGHGFPGNPAGRQRPEATVPAELLAAQGYMTVAYDARGTGAARDKNPESLGSEFMGRSELLDLAEVVRLIEKDYGASGAGIADVSRLGITGFSYGGALSWKAAAWSGRNLPANNRGIMTFPIFKAAYAIDNSPYDAPHKWVIDGAAFRSGAMAIIRSQAEYEPSFAASVMAALSANDPAQLAAIWAQDPWRQDIANLGSSTVPVMMHLQWNSSRVGEGLAVLDAMPQTTPTRAFLSTNGGHGEPVNLRQDAQTRVFTQRWFDRFVKEIPNQVDTEPRVVTGVVPETDELHRNPDTLVRHRYSETWGPTGAELLKYYLRQGEALSTEAPTTAEPAETIDHVVNSGWTWDRFLAEGGRTILLNQAFLLSSTRYDTPATSEPLEIAGSPRVVLEVSPQSPTSDYQLHCALYQVPAQGPERFLQAGVAVVTGNSNAQQLTVEFNDIHVYVPAGDKLRLKIENLTRTSLAGLPMGFVLYSTIPFFTGATVNIEHTSARPSWLEIPVAEVIEPSLTSATVNLDTAAPPAVVFHVDGTPARGGDLYFLAFGASGISPGTSLGSVTALLNSDALTDAMLLLLGTPFVPHGFGTLNQAGIADPQPQMVLGGVPSLTSFAGLRLNVVAIVVSNNRMVPSSPLDVILR